MIHIAPIRLRLRHPGASGRPPHGPNRLSWIEAVAEPLHRLNLDSEEVGQMLSILDGYREGCGRSLEESFAFGLERVLDGIEAYLAR